MKNLNPLDPKYLIKAGHDLLFQETKEWRSDLEFYHNEIHFFKKLLDKTFLRVTNKAETDDIERVQKEIDSLLNIKYGKLHVWVTNHENHLGMLEEATYGKSEESIIEDHTILKNDLNEFISEMKQLKNEIFLVVEKIIHSAKLAESGFEEGSISL